MKRPGDRTIRPGPRFPLIDGLVPAEAGHEVQIFLTGEATYTMRKATVEALQP